MTTETHEPGCPWDLGVQARRYRAKTKLSHLHSLYKSPMFNKVLIMMRRPLEVYPLLPVSLLS